MMSISSNELQSEVILGTVTAPGRKMQVPYLLALCYAEAFIKNQYDFQWLD